MPEEGFTSPVCWPAAVGVVRVPACGCLRRSALSLHLSPLRRLRRGRRASPPSAALAICFSVQRNVQNTRKCFFFFFFSTAPKKQGGPSSVSLLFLVALLFSPLHSFFPSCHRSRDATVLSFKVEHSKSTGPRVFLSSTVFALLCAGHPLCARCGSFSDALLLLPSWLQFGGRCIRRSCIIAAVA